MRISALLTDRYRAFLSTAWLRYFSAGLVCIALSSCGGGHRDAPTEADLSGRETALAVGNVSADSASIVSVESISLKAERRVSRTVFEYDYEITVHNQGSALSDVMVTLIAAGPGTEIVDASVVLGSLGSGATVTPSDTITIRQDRSFPFQIAQLQWHITGTPIQQVDPTVTWNPGAFNVTVVQGTSQTTQVALTTSGQVNNVSLVIGPEIAGVMQMSLLGNTVIKPGAATRVATEVSVPVSTPPGTYEGTVTVLSGAQTMSTALTVKIQVVAGSSSQVVNQVADPSPDRVARTQSGQFLIKDEVLVALNGDIADPATRIREIAENVGALIIGSVPGLPLYQLRFAGADVLTVEAHREALRGLSGVRAVSLSLLGSGLKFPAEGLYPFATWDEKRADGPNGHLEFIRAPEAWDITTGSTGAAAKIVAVIDDGFDFEHPDLVGNIEFHSDETPITLPVRLPFENADKTRNRIPGHGTEVAGTLCAKGTDTGEGIGVVGVAWNCKLRLYRAARTAWEKVGNNPFRFIDCQLNLTLGTDRQCDALMSLPRLVEQMKRAIDDGATVVNMSVGFIEPNCFGGACTEPALLAQKVQDANDFLLEGFAYDTDEKVLWVIAAGNEGREASAQSPASFKQRFPRLGNIIVVAGTLLEPNGNVNANGLRVQKAGTASAVGSSTGGSNYGANDNGSSLNPIIDVASPWFCLNDIPKILRSLPNRL